MIKYWIKRSTDAKSSILSDSVVASFEVIKQLKTDQQKPDLYSLVARGTAGESWVIRFNQPAANLPALANQLKKIRTDIEGGSAAGKTMFFVEIDADDVPEFK